MTKDELLELPLELENINLIREYLNQTLPLVDYQAAFIHLLKIESKYNLYTDVLLDGEQLLKSMESQTNSLYYHELLDILVNSAILSKKIDQANKYIILRKESLPIIKSYLTSIDEIKLKKILKEEYSNEIENLLTEVLPDDIRIVYLKELLDIYIDKNKYSEAEAVLEQLENYDVEYILLEKKLEVLINLKKLDEVITLANEYIEYEETRTVSFLALMRVYIEKKDFHKAMILDAEYENHIESEDLIKRKKAYELLVKLYKEINNKISLDLYQKKLKAVLKLIDKSEEVVNIKENIVEEVVSKKIVLQTIRDKKQAISDNKLDTNLITDIFNYSFNISENVPFREFLRMLFIEVEKNVSLKNCVIYLKDESPNLYNYKVERVYDKSIINELLENTLFEYVLNSKDEINESVEMLKWKKDLATQKDFLEDIHQVLAYPLGDYGVLSIYLAKEDNYIEPFLLFKMISNIVLTRISNDKKTKRIRKESMTYKKIFDNPFLSMRIMQEFRSTFNENAQKLFNVNAHNDLELFVIDIKSDEVNEYKEKIRDLFSKKANQAKIKYHYQDKIIEEYLYGVQVNDEHLIISFFDDVTEKKRSDENLLKNVTHDNELNIGNYLLFKDTFSKNVDNKMTVLLIELDQTLKSIYGSEVMIRYLKELVILTKEFFNIDYIFRYDIDKIVLILPGNDIRTMTKLASDYLIYLENYKSSIILNNTYDINFGILRYPVVSEEKRLDKIFRFVEIALNKAKNKGKNNYVFFKYSDFEEEKFEEQVINHLNECLEKGDLEINFRQIIDVSRNQVWQYESEINVSNINIDNRYLLMVAKKRNKIIDLDKMHINLICKFLSKLEQETKKLIKITIPISKESILENNFIDYLVNTFKRYKLPYEFIRLKLDVNRFTKELKEKIKDIVEKGISIDVCSFDAVINYQVNALHLNHEKMTDKYLDYIKLIKDYCDKYSVALVIRKVDKKEEITRLKELDIKYIESDIYQKIDPIKLIMKIKGV